MDGRSGRGDPERRSVARGGRRADRDAGAIAAFEGPNELDHGGESDVARGLRAYMPALQAAARAQAPGVPLIGPSFSKAGKSRRLAHDAARHRQPPSLPRRQAAGARPRRGAWREVAGGHGKGIVQFTETGYHNAMNDAAAQPPVSEAVAAVYLPRLLVTAFGAGVKRTFVYELADERPEPALSRAGGALRPPAQRPVPQAGLRGHQDADRRPGTSPRARRAARRRRDWQLEAPGDVDGRAAPGLVRRDGSQVHRALAPRRGLGHGAAAADATSRRRRVDLRFARPARDVVVWRPSTRRPRSCAAGPGAPALPRSRVGPRAGQPALSRHPAVRLRIGRVGVAGQTALMAIALTNSPIETRRSAFWAGGDPALRGSLRVRPLAVDSPASAPEQGPNTGCRLRERSFRHVRGPSRRQSNGADLCPAGPGQGAAKGRTGGGDRRHFRVVDLRQLDRFADELGGTTRSSASR